MKAVELLQELLNALDAMDALCTRSGKERFADATSYYAAYRAAEERVAIARRKARKYVR